MAEAVTSPAEVTIRYAANAPDLQAALTFVMEYMDRVGSDPSVTISPVWGEVRTFDVSISGTTTEEEP